MNEKDVTKNVRHDGSETGGKSRRAIIQPHFYAPGFTTIALVEEGASATTLTPCYYDLHPHAPTYRHGRGDCACPGRPVREGKLDLSTAPTIADALDIEAPAAGQGVAVVIQPTEGATRTQLDAFLAIVAPPNRVSSSAVPMMIFLPLNPEIPEPRLGDPSERGATLGVTRT